MYREIDGYAIEICGESIDNCKNSVCECFSTWNEAIKQLGKIVEEKTEQYDSNPICLLRLSSQETCNTSGIVSVYLFTKANVIIQIRAIFTETASLQVPLNVQSSLID